MQTIVNLGTGGADLNGQNGSTSSADSNDALFLDWPGDNAGNYVYLPGVSGNYLSVPDEAALDITGDIDLRVYVAADDWTPSAAQGLMSKWLSSTSQRGYSIQLNTNGTLTFYWSTAGTVTLFKTSTVATGLTDGNPSWVRATLDVDNDSGGHDVSFYLSDDGETWNQLGATVTTAGTTSIYANTEAVYVGASQSNGLAPAAGKFYRAQIFDGIDGTKVLDVDTSAITSGSATSFTALTGQTVTINRSTSGRKSVAVVAPVWLFGTDDYMQVADNALLDFGASDSFTVLAIIRQWATPLSSGTYIAKYDSVSATAYSLANQLTSAQSRFFAGDGTATPSALVNAATYGETQTTVGVRDVTSDTLTIYANGTAGSPVSDTTTGSLANALPLFIGKRNGSAAYQEFELLSVAVFRRALTATEISALTTYYQNRWS